MRTASPVHEYFALREPVILVTVGVGREVFRSSMALFRRLASLRARRDVVMALWQGDRCLKTESVGAINAMVHKVGLRPFARACESRRGPERAYGSKWSWSYLGEYLGFEWGPIP